MQVYSDEIKAQVLADAALGMSKSAIARKHNIHETDLGELRLEFMEHMRAGAILAREHYWRVKAYLRQARQR